MVFSTTKIPIRRPDVKLAQKLVDVIIEKSSLISTIDGSYW
jgi:hypothetical protein